MPDGLLDDPTIPPPGRRNGEGSASILPYLARTLAAKPMAAPSGPAPQSEREPADDAARPAKRA